MKNLTIQKVVKALNSAYMPMIKNIIGNDEDEIREALENCIFYDWTSSYSLAVLNDAIEEYWFKESMLAKELYNQITMEFEFYETNFIINDENYNIDDLIKFLDKFLDMILEVD